MNNTGCEYLGVTGGKQGNFSDEKEDRKFNMKGKANRI